MTFIDVDEVNIVGVDDHDEPDSCIAADVSTGRHRAELARQGSLADRHLPASHVGRSGVSAAGRQNSNAVDAIGAGSGGSGCVSVETAESGETPDSEAEDDLDHEQQVKFLVEDDKGGDDKMRLHRRDTPHHLKNKRINQQVSFILYENLKSGYF